MIVLEVLRYRLIVIVQSICFYNCWCNLFEIYNFSCERECYVIESSEIGISFSWRIRIRERHYFVIGNTSGLGKSLNKRRWQGAMYIWFTLRMRTPAVTFYFSWVTHLTYDAASVPWSKKRIKERRDVASVSCWVGKAAGCIVVGLVCLAD